MKTLRIALLACAAATAPAEEVAVPGGAFDVQFTGAPSPELHKVATAWVVTSGRAIAHYYGTYPVRHAVLKITLRGGHEARDGEASGWFGPMITMGLGRATTSADLADDWMLPHEMLHLCFPNLDERHHWLEEGLASYLEPIARARVGLITPERVWADLVEGLPQGQPAAGDRGLDRTPTWGRTYWGGALFCVKADVEIRRRTGNRQGLEHAVRAIAAAGGTIENTWKIERVIAVGDGATGVPVLGELYEQMKATPVTVDLATMWKQLGVTRRGPGVVFDDTAPLAAVRKAITAR